MRPELGSALLLLLTQTIFSCHFYDFSGASLAALETAVSSIPIP